MASKLQIINAGRAMKLIMAFSTNRNDIKPMLRLIAMPVMILLRRFRAINTEQRMNFRQFASIHSVIYNIFRFPTFRMTNTKTLIYSFAFLSLTIALITCFTFFCFEITSNSLTIAFSAPLSLTIFFYSFTIADLTISSMVIFPCSIFVKFRNRLDLLANGTSFRYDLFRHCFSPIKKSYCLEPVAGHVPAVGSSYSTCLFINVNNKKRKI